MAKEAGTEEGPEGGNKAVEEVNVVIETSTW
jgi:hypothetical protein